MFDFIIEFFTKNGGALLDYAIQIPCVIFALAIHELAHGYMAYKLGDPTAKEEGRLSLNPLKNIDPIGAICLFLFQVGWTRPVPVLPDNFKNKRAGVILTSLAGPVANFVASYIFTVLYMGMIGIETKLTVIDGRDLGFGGFLLTAFSNFLILIAGFNLLLAIFNLLPIFPLDGSRVLMMALPNRVRKPILRYEKYIAIGFVVLLIIDSFYTRFILNSLQSLFDFFMTNCFVPPYEKLLTRILFG